MHCTMKTLSEVKQITGLKLDMNEDSVLLRMVDNGSTLCSCLDSWYNAYFVVFSATANFTHPERRYR